MDPPWLSQATEAPAAMFRALADPTRRRILELLVAGPASPGELARRLGLPRVNVSHHLSVLAAAELVDQRQRRASVRPESLTVLRRYFDLALTTAAIALPDVSHSVSQATHR